jgi:hypothetical protein
MSLGGRAPRAALQALSSSVERWVAEQGRVELLIRTKGNELNVRELNAFFALLDGIYGRLDSDGLRSYAQSRHRQLSIDHVRAGSVEWSLLFDLLHQADLWRVLIVYIIAKAGPSILDGSAAKNWAEATKSTIETYRLLKPLAKRGAFRIDDRGESSLAAASNAPRFRLSRRQRTELRTLLASDPLLSQLSKRHEREVLALIERLLDCEKAHIAAASRFESAYLVEVVLRQRP